MTWLIEGLRAFVLPMRPASRYRWLAYVILAIGFAGLISPHGWFGSPTTILSWLAVIVGSSIGFGVPLMWLLSLATLLIPGVVQSSFVASAGSDRHLETTYTAIRIHYPLLLVAVGILLAAFYRYRPRVPGKYDEYLGMLHFWMTFIGLTLMFAPERIPFHFLLIPRRYLDYPEAFLMWQKWWWYGLGLVALGGLIFTYFIVDTYRRERPI